ncbi:hypothetical protein PIB30_052496 [Stylosanthes scabra]|uniref:DUF1985 domain-containing protein n=1 Tax=Stylosanthes scabra TaxID=79078 RepID=A0ABU6UIL7_9FABA|nr:hypothetical protein [Stylosanthes scabra]
MAKSYNLQRDCLMMDVDNIHVNGASIGHALGLPSHGYEFLSFDKKNPKHEQIKSMFQGKSLKWLKNFVLVCPMTSEEERRVFPHAFLLMVVKGFLCPTPSASISPEMHLPLILDVENPMKYNWSLQSFHWLRDGIDEYQNKGKKHIGGCTFALLILYFQTMKCGPLEFCDCQMPWTSQWSTNKLEEKAKAVQKKYLKNNTKAKEEVEVDKKKTVKKRVSKKKRVEKDDDDSEENIPIARKKAARITNEKNKVDSPKERQVHLNVENLEEVKEKQEQMGKEETIETIKNWSQIQREMNSQQPEKIPGIENTEWKELLEELNSDPVYAMNVFGGFSGTPSTARSSLTLGLILEPKPLKALPASPVENGIAPSDEELTDVDKDTIYNWVMRSSKNKQVLGESVAWYCV